MARIFGLDPLTVLDADPFERDVRLAAAKAAIRQMEKERAP